MERRQNLVEKGKERKREAWKWVSVYIEGDSERGACVSVFNGEEDSE